MNEERKILAELMAEIEDLIEQNENPDGTFNFDYLRARVALEFAKTEIAKSISKQIESTH